MSSFRCEVCGVDCIETPRGYVTGHRGGHSDNSEIDGTVSCRYHDSRVIRESSPAETAIPARGEAKHPKPAKVSNVRPH